MRRSELKTNVMNSKTLAPFNHTVYHRETRHCDSGEPQKISDFFYQQLNSNAQNLNKTHFFKGRYENIYLKDSQFLPLKNFEHNAKSLAAQLLQCEAQELSMDYWFNDMPPHHITDWHRHDVMDERLSGVYYLKIPKKSGDLLLKSSDSIHTIHPKENDFVFFKPDANHYVEENQSEHSRLSIGMNFGFMNDKE